MRNGTRKWDVGTLIWSLYHLLLLRTIPAVNQLHQLIQIAPLQPLVPIKLHITIPALNQLIQINLPPPVLPIELGSHKLSFHLPLILLQGHMSKNRNTLLNSHQLIQIELPQPVLRTELSLHLSLSLLLFQGHLSKHGTTLLNRHQLLLLLMELSRRLMIQGHLYKHSHLRIDVGRFCRSPLDQVVKSSRKGSNNSLRIWGEWEQGQFEFFQLLQTLHHWTCLQ